MNMWKTVIIIIIVLAIIVGIAVFTNKEVKAPTIETMNNDLKLTSSAFKHEGEIPSKYTCDGENINPPFEISGIPENTQSLALIIDDPDATGGGTFDHWIIWNINSEAEEITEGKVPEGTLQGTNNFGNTEYGGPCPPEGNEPHRYMFKLYALDTELNLEEGASKSNLEDVMGGHILAQTTLMGRYGR